MTPQPYCGITIVKLAADTWIGLQITLYLPDEVEEMTLAGGEGRPLEEDEQTKITPLLESCLKLGLEILKNQEFSRIEEEEYQQLMDNSTCPLKD